MQNYDIYINNGEGEKLFYRANVPDIAVYNIIYKQTMGSAGSLSFCVPVLHPYAKEINPITTEILLKKNEKLIYRGRFIGNKEDFNRTGTITCEGDLNYLIDSLQEPYEFSGSIEDFFDYILTNHNNMVEDRKKFKKGIVNVVDKNNYIARSNEDYSTSLECLKEKLVETHGGYLRVRYEQDGNYLDYLTDFGGINSQIVRFAENLLNIENYIDASNIITCLIPVGAKIEGSKESGVKGKVDISSVNDGKKYIIDEAGVAKWGEIWGTHEWQDVTLPENLLTKARAYLTEQTALPKTMTLTALDLSLINADIEEFKLGCWTNIVSDFHDLKGQYLLKEINIDISNPQNSTIVLGGNTQSLSGSVAKQSIEASRKVDALANNTATWINQAIENATQLIQGGLGGYVVLNPNPQTGLPEEILIMDAPEKENAVHVIRLNKNGIGFSNTGYDGTYDNAWTIDGNLVADFIKSGTMTAIKIQNGDPDTTPSRIVIDETSSLKGYQNNEMVNIINMSQAISGTGQLTIDAKNQLNIRTPKLVVENQSHGEAGSTGTVAKTTDANNKILFVSNVQKDFNNTMALGLKSVGEDDYDTVYCTLPVYLKNTYSSLNTINGFVTSNAVDHISPIY